MTEPMQKPKQDPKETPKQEAPKQDPKDKKPEADRVFLPAEWNEKELKELDAIEKGNKRMIAALLKAEVFILDSDEPKDQQAVKDFNGLRVIDPKWYCAVSLFDRKKQEFTQEWKGISGADLRMKILTLTCYAHKKKLDESEREELYMKVFGQKTFPDYKSEKDPVKREQLGQIYLKGIALIDEYAIDVAGEVNARGNPKIPRGESVEREVYERMKKERQEKYDKEQAEIAKKKKEEAEKKQKEAEKKQQELTEKKKTEGNKDGTEKPIAEEEKKKEPAKQGGMDSNEQTSIQRQAPEIVRALGRLQLVVDETQSGELAKNPAMAGALLSVAESELDQAFTGARTASMSIPFKAITQIVGAKKGVFELI